MLHSSPISERGRIDDTGHWFFDSRGFHKATYARKRETEIRYTYRNDTVQSYAIPAQSFACQKGSIHSSLRVCANTADTDEQKTDSALPPSSASSTSSALTANGERGGCSDPVCVACMGILQLTNTDDFYSNLLAKLNAVRASFVDLSIFLKECYA